MSDPLKGFNEALAEAARRVGYTGPVPNLSEIARNAGIPPRPDEDFDIETNRPLSAPDG